MSNTLQVFVKFIYNKLNKRLEEDTSDTPFGFRNGLVTRADCFASTY